MLVMHLIPPLKSLQLSVSQKQRVICSPRPMSKVVHPRLASSRPSQQALNVFIAPSTELCCVTQNVALPGYNSSQSTCLKNALLNGFLIKEITSTFFSPPPTNPFVSYPSYSLSLDRKREIEEEDKKHFSPVVELIMTPSASSFPIIFWSQLKG